MTPNNAELAQRDLRVLWHPCTQMKDHEQLPMIPIRRGQGVWLEDYDGKRYLDAISSWWVNLFGHAHPRINAAVKHQLDELEHVLLAGFTHEPIVRLSERLIALAPPGLVHAFYGDSGSAAVEIALKMSFHCWRNRGQTRKTRFVCLANSYHGETLGALAVGDVALYKDTYEPLLMQALTVPSPDCFQREPGETCADVARRQFEHLEQLLAARHDEIAAVILEPLIQCAGSMRMYDPEYLRLARAACDRYAVHLIADEVAVGFGRTGTLFAVEQAGISPDFLCLAKGLTGGYLPLSVVLTTAEVYGRFYDDYTRLTAFLHSHSYTGNPLACAAALATLELFDEYDTLNHNRILAQHMAASIAGLTDHPHVGDVRQTGMVAAIELVRDKAAATPYDWRERRGLRLYQAGLKQGAILRPLGNVVYLMPPYVITQDELSWLGTVVTVAIEQACQ
ncbi:MAG: adenosylmethionine--8-amino-7-oxononanoate transaminase [Thiotrichales bacterium]